MPVPRNTEDDILVALGNQRILPLISAPYSEAVATVGELLLAHQLPVLEVTLRTPSSLRVISELVKRNPGLVVGAGSVVTPEQVRAAAEVGAQFIVSPGYSDSVVRMTRQVGLTPLPGVATPSEIQCAVEQGLQMLKLFPAEQLGGVKFIDALSAPLPNTRFIPSGGITRSLLPAYLQHPSVAAAGCSWILPTDAFSEQGSKSNIEARIIDAIAIREEIRQ